jgi:hypothetical protein
MLRQPAQGLSGGSWQNKTSRISRKYPDQPRDLNHPLKTFFALKAVAGKRQPDARHSGHPAIFLRFLRRQSATARLALLSASRN